MTIKKDFKELLIFTTFVLFVAIAVGVYAPIWRIPCLVISFATVVMFSYTGRTFIQIEQLARSVLYAMEKDAPKTEPEEEGEDFGDVE